MKDDLPLELVNFFLLIRVINLEFPNNTSHFRHRLVWLIGGNQGIKLVNDVYHNN